MKFREFLNEGVWATPNTTKKAKELQKVFRSPITREDAKRKLYNIIGTDSLYDNLDDSIMVNDEDDVR